MKSIISFHPFVQFSAEPYERGSLSAQRTVEPDPFRFYSITKENKRRSRARRVLHRLISKERNRSKTGHEGAASPQPSQYLRTADLPFRTGGISPPGSHPWHFCLRQLKFSSAELNLKKNSHHIWHLVYKINPIPRKVKSCFTKKRENSWKQGFFLSTCMVVKNIFLTLSLLLYALLQQLSGTNAWLVHHFPQHHLRNNSTRPSYTLPQHDLFEQPSYTI